MPEGVPTQESVRVLVVDDSTVMRQAIRKMLQSDYEVILANDGEAGWAQLEGDGSIKVLITDIEMPNLDGYGFICRARASEAAHIRDIPIIAITGAEDDETKARAYACGATDFITKPLDRLQLQARVHAYVQFDQTTRELTEKTAALEEEAINDPVTQLRSRRYFLQRGEQDLAFAIRHEEPLSLVRLDIDNFKKLYQQHGDDAVDHILVRLANVLAAAARTEDTIARIGGAEFAILAPRTDRASALALCQRLSTTVGEQRLNFDGADIALTVSMGLVTLGPDHRNTIEDLTKLAEQRLSHAKSEGGNRVSVSVFGEALEPEIVTLSAPEPLPDNPAVTQAAARYLAQEPVRTSPLLYDLISIDRALAILARGEGATLAPYLSSLVQQVLPLLELYSEQIGSDAGNALQALKAKLPQR